jgi:tRNA pseudouridine55 synthase
LKRGPSTFHKLFVAYKPTGLSSNQFLGRIKRRYNTRKAGYSGTLDPFAKGALIVALGNHTRLFRFLKKTPKRYRATLWIGAHSDTLDIEAVHKIDTLDEISEADIKEVMHSLQGELTYLPPKFCAKKINGQRAYDLARRGEEVILNEITSTIHDIKFLHYCHPFITFEATVSEGTYIRSLGEIIAQKLNVSGGILTALERLNEGQFSYNNEITCDIKTSLDMDENFYLGDKNNIFYGKKLDINDFKVQDNAKYWIDCGDTISIIEILENEVNYLLNKVEVEKDEIVENKIEENTLDNKANLC